MFLIVAQALPNQRFGQLCQDVKFASTKRSGVADFRVFPRTFPLENANFPVGMKKLAGIGGIPAVRGGTQIFNSSTSHWLPSFWCSKMRVVRVSIRATRFALKATQDVNLE